jgi:DNA repair protein SbcC/Rad50
MNSVFLKRLHIQRAPGMPEGISPIDLGQGLTVIIGPNESGKSTVARALRGLLWESERDSMDRVQSEWIIDGTDVVAELFDGGAFWKPHALAGAPAASGLASLGMRNMLNSESETERTVAAKLAKELAGGLDLSELRKQFQHPERLAGNTLIARDRKEAIRKSQEANRNTRDLLQKEERLASLEKQVSTARKASEKLDTAMALSNLVSADDLLGVLESEGECFRPGLNNLVGDEAAKLNQLNSELQDLQRELGDLESDLGNLDKQLQGLKFPKGPPQLEDLDAYGKRITALEELSRNQDRILPQIKGERSKRDSARACLTCEPVGEPLTPSQLDSLAPKTDSLRKACAEARASARAVEIWENYAQVDDENEAGLRDAIRALRDWLRAPEEVVIGEAVARSSQFLFAVSGLSLIVGIVAWVFAQSLSASIVGLLVLGCILLLHSFSSHRNQGKASKVDVDARMVARRSVESTKYLPDSWTVNEVNSFLSNLEHKLALVLTADRAKVHVHSSQQDKVRSEREAVDLSNELKDTLRDVGLAEDLGELDAVAQLAAFSRYRESSDECARLDSELCSIGEDLDCKLKDVASWLEGFDIKKTIDVAGASAALTSLSNRCTAFHEKTQARASAAREQVRKNREVGVCESNIAEIWECAGLDGAESGASAELQRMVDSLEGFRSWTEKFSEARTERRLKYIALSNQDLSALLESREYTEVPREEIANWIEQFGATKSHLDGFNKEIGGIETELHTAKGAWDLSDATAALNLAESNVAAERESAVEASLIRMLLDDAQQVQAEDNAPELLKLARERFSLFTDNQWRLEVGANSEYVASNANTNETVSLEELSDGTRIQLLLAARLTALEMVEAGRALPIALDEVLSTTDPRRFQSVARTLFEVADAGRQILYLAADPSEAAQWCQAARAMGHDEPAVVDLGVLRGEPADWAGDLPAVPERPAPAPDPAGMDAEAYARQLRVPKPDGFAEPSSWHIYFAAYGDLPALRETINRRIKTIGHWRAMRDGGTRPEKVTEAQFLKIDARSDLAIALAPLWRIGRGRPVSWDDVGASGAVTDKFEDRVREALREHFTDAEAFLRAVAGIKGFRSATEEKLREQLMAIGCLSNVQILDHEDLVRRTIASAHAAAEQLEYADAAAYVDWLIGLLNG